MPSDLSETKREHLEKKIEAYTRHQKQHMGFLESMEAIRWKFITAFGIGAGIALFLTSSNAAARDAKGGDSFNELAAALVIIISLASLITQIRINAVVHAMWYRIRCLQRVEGAILDQLYGFATPLKKAIEFPQLIYSNRLHHYITVHMAVSAAFCAIIGLVLEMAFAGNAWYYRIAWFAIPTIGLVLTTWFITDWYAKLLKSGIDIDAIE